MNIEYTRRLEKIETILSSRLPKTIDPLWTCDTFSILPDAVRSMHMQPLVEPCRDLLLRGGKRWRPLLMVLCCELLGGEDRAYGLVPLVEYVHTASLIHDDIEDHADMRRGKPAIHILYGVDTAINSASWLYFHAQSIIDSFPSSDSLKLQLHKTLTRELRRLHLGQAMDIRWHRESSFIPVRSEYEAMVSLKTGTLSRLASEVGMIAASAQMTEITMFGDIASRIGVGFQVLDDVRNLEKGNPGKKRGDDVVEGKKSLPVILHLEKHPEDTPFFASSFLKAREEGVDSPVIETVIERLMQSNSIEAAKEYGLRLIEGSCLSVRGHYPDNCYALLIAGLFESMTEDLR